MPGRKPRVLVFIVAYNAEKTIGGVLDRIPRSLSELYEVEVLIIDDSSGDSTFERSLSASSTSASGFPIRTLFNPVNQGYGGNQKIGYHYAIKHGFDFVVLVHGDGQYAPECLPAILEPLRSRDAQAVFGSRMLTRMGALRGGMPLYKFAGNKILSWIENRLLRSDLSEFHSGYRSYSVGALRQLPFDLNSNDFHFDTEIIIQLLVAQFRIAEVPIPTYYGDEICYVNGLKYGFNVIKAVVKARLQELGLFYERRFDCAPSAERPYTLKLGYTSPHSMTLERVRAGARVLDLGCAGGYMGALLRQRKQCNVTGVDTHPPAEGSLDRFDYFDLNQGLPRAALETYDYILFLDVVEHLSSPEEFLRQLRYAAAINPQTEIIISTGNIAFFITRLMLLIGQFNYGKRGILDVTHHRLFTFASLRRALEQTGFTVLETRGVPAPFPLALGDGMLGRMLVRVNAALIGLARGLFSYQIFMRVKPRPSLEYLLNAAQEESSKKIASWSHSRSD